jgi:hypothetical protein
MDVVDIFFPVSTYPLSLLFLLIPQPNTHKIYI